MVHNAADPKSIRKAQKAERQRQVERDGVLLSLLSSPAGRSYVHDWLLRCHVFSTPFTGLAATTDFACGEQNIGLQLLGDVMRAAPDQYVQMMREANDREQADGRRTGNDDGRIGDQSDERRADNDPNSGLVDDDYDPTDFYDRERADTSN